MTKNLGFFWILILLRQLRRDFDDLLCMGMTQGGIVLDVGVHTDS